MLGISANNPHNSLAMDNLAFVTYPFYGCPNLHDPHLFFTGVSAGITDNTGNLDFITR
jgi:hypothetical protein